MWLCENDELWCSWVSFKFCRVLASVLMILGVLSQLWNGHYIERCKEVWSWEIFCICFTLFAKVMMMNIVMLER